MIINLLLFVGLFFVFVSSFYKTEEREEETSLIDKPTVSLFIPAASIILLLTVAQLILHLYFYLDYIDPLLSILCWIQVLLFAIVHPSIPSLVYWFFGAALVRIGFEGYTHMDGSQLSFTLVALDLCKFLLVSSLLIQRRPVTVDGFYRKLQRLLPFLWPKSLSLQLLVVACLFLLTIGRVVNVLVPFSYKLVVEDLSSARQTSWFAWSIVFYTLLRFLQGGVGLVSSLQSFLWIPVGQYTTRTICVEMLSHLHSLSLEFHIQRKTGEVLRILDRGTSSISSLLSYLVFNIMPVFVDIGFAVIYFSIAFDRIIATVVLITMLSYIFVTILITEWRTKFRREMNDLDTSSRGRAVDSLLNFETVKYFGNEAFEVEAYENAILEYQKADWKSSSSLSLLNTAQNMVITIGLLIGLFLCSDRVISKQLTVGDFVSFITYLLQLYQPLNWFGTYYRVIQQNFIDMEKMLDMFEEKRMIEDAPDAQPLLLTRGGIAFKNVTFSYGDSIVLDNISFDVPAGKTVALVGATGSGKSTLLRLLFRFYDIQFGSIEIDGQDIRHVQQKSLRSHIGVVPQDTVLFNESILFNIRYGNLDATDEQIYEAAKAAQIHDKILAFTDGYETKVGERGLRLSGGEKQRVAIARTVLKNPPIILLDEATSSLDNVTEKLIQSALDTLCATRTTLVVAHRLSTIIKADVILVMEKGKIVERGTHESLLENKNVYYQLWHSQQ